MGLKLIPDDTHIDFLKYRKLWVGLSIAAILGSIALFFIQGLNYGIDFKGGTLIMAETVEDTPVGEFRPVLNDLGLGDVGVTKVSDPGGAARNAVMIRVGITGVPGATRAPSATSTACTKPSSSTRSWASST